MVSCIAAISVAEDARIWLRNARYIRLLNSFDAAWNLVDEHDRVVSVVTSAIGNGPLNVVVEAPKLPALSEAEIPCITPYQIKTSNITIYVDHAPPWDATLPRPVELNVPRMVRIGKDVLRHSTGSLAQPCFDFTPSTSVFEQMALEQLSLATRQVVSALIEDDNQALIAASDSLAGKGIGLTPAGDDWLLGCMVALHCLGHHEKAGLIAQSAQAHTTIFSAALLAMAGQRKLSELWHQMVMAETTERTHTAMLRLRQRGFTSGADALTGFIHVLEALSPETSSSSQSRRK